MVFPLKFVFSDFLAIAVFLGKFSDILDPILSALYLPVLKCILMLFVSIMKLDLVDRGNPFIYHLDLIFDFFGGFLALFSLLFQLFFISSFPTFLFSV